MVQKRPRQEGHRSRRLRNADPITGPEHAADEQVDSRRDIDELNRRRTGHLWSVTPPQRLYVRRGMARHIDDHVFRFGHRVPIETDRR